jgi:hypothetical protein
MEYKNNQKTTKKAELLRIAYQIIDFFREERKQMLKAKLFCN